MKEVKAKTDDSVWRRDEESGASYALKLTAAGAKAIVADEDAEPENADNEGGALENHSQLAVPSETAVQVAPSAEAMEPVAAGPSAPRSGSKLARVIELLQRDHGATIDELIDATDWLAHTTRAALTGLRKRGYSVVIDRSEQSFYRIQADLSAGDRAFVARQVEERANSAAARKPAQHSRSRARRSSRPPMPPSQTFSSSLARSGSATTSCVGPWTTSSEIATSGADGPSGLQSGRGGGGSRADDGVEKHRLNRIA